jgi:hypothetical protein
MHCVYAAALDVLEALAQPGSARPTMINAAPCVTWGGTARRLHSTSQIQSSICCLQGMHALRSALRSAWKKNGTVRVHALYTCAQQAQSQ